MGAEELLDRLDRAEDSHKGMNGKVGVIGGCKDFSGAPAFNAYGALRSGCDLVRIVTSAEIRDVVRSYSENFIVEDYPSGYFGLSGVEQCLELARWSDVVVFGSGLGSPDEEAVREFIERCDNRLVIDADAIKPSLSSDLSNAVLTPHEAEAEYIREEFGSVQSFIEEKKAVVVLKGEVDRIFTPEGEYKNRTGHVTMTVGGTGDVLAGLIASLISQGLDIKEAARAGAWLNGKAGEKAFEQKGYGMLATDLVEKIPEAMR